MVDLSNGEVSTIAGDGSAGFMEGTGTTAKFNKPSGVAVDGGGFLYVTDYSNHRIRKINLSTRQTSTIAGASFTGLADGTGANARFFYPMAIAADGSGYLYVAEAGSTRVRKITISTGAVTTIAGSSIGYSDGAGTAAKFSSPAGIAVDATGNLYVGDRNNYRSGK